MLRVQFLVISAYLLHNKFKAVDILCDDVLRQVALVSQGQIWDVFNSVFSNEKHYLHQDTVKKDT
jgi:hypothetical protein